VGKFGSKKERAWEVRAAERHQGSRGPGNTHALVFQKGRKSPRIEKGERGEGQCTYRLERF